MLFHFSCNLFFLNILETITLYNRNISNNIMSNFFNIIYFSLLSKVPFFNQMGGLRSVWVVSNTVLLFCFSILVLWKSKFSFKSLFLFINFLFTRFILCIFLLCWKQLYNTNHVILSILHHLPEVSGVSKIIRCV